VGAAKISVCIVCRNEARKLALCLPSVAWADEVIVMDLSSEDDSVGIARAHGATVIEHEPVPIVELVRNEIADAADGEWVLALDPDEQVTPGLAAELQSISERSNVDAVYIPRMNIDFGHAPSNALQRYEPQLRMYRREKVRWPLLPNKLPTVPEDRTLRLPSRDEFVLIHDRNQSIPEAVERIMRYAPAEARAMIERGETFTARAMAAELREKADKYFVQGRAFDDGVPGVMRAWILLNFQFYVWAAFWHMSGAERTAADDRFVRKLARPVYGIFGAARFAAAARRQIRDRRR
jgi:glycosyltransferase involved in cell wall biosynthesis